MKLCTVFHAFAAGSVLFCGTIPVMADSDVAPADLIITNAHVITLDADSTVAQAIAVRAKQVILVGHDYQMFRLRGPETRVIDAKGVTVMPGLYDGEVNSYQAAVSELNGYLPVFNSIPEALDYIRAQVEQKPPGSWITVERAYPTRLKENRLPTKAELDSVAPKNPVFWNCGSIAMVNSKALEVSKITSISTNPPGGEIVIDSRTLKPSGLLRNASQMLKLPAKPKPVAIEQRREALKHLYKLYNEQGVTSIAESGADVEAINLFRDMACSNELTVRVNCSRYIDPSAITADEDVAAKRLAALTNAPKGTLPYGPTGAGDEWVRIGALTTRMDGDVLTGTAYMRTPWGLGQTYQFTEPAYRGRLDPDPDALAAFFTFASTNGWQLSADCTGDAALDQLLNCFQRVQFTNDIHLRRFVINHATFQTDQAWERCRKLGIGAEFEPMTLYRDGTSLLKTIGEKRLKNFMALGSSFEEGMVVGAGSGHSAKLDNADSTNPWNPWLGLWVTLTRQTAQNSVIYAKEEKLTRQQAVQLYTLNNARLHFEDEYKGSLEAGKLADLLLLDRDILKCPVDDVRDTKVQITLLAGKIVWEQTNTTPLTAEASAPQLGRLAWPVAAK